MEEKMIHVRLDPATTATMPARILQEFPAFIIAEVDGKIGQFKQFGEEWHQMTSLRPIADFKRVYPSELYSF